MVKEPGEYGGGSVIKNEKQQKKTCCVKQYAKIYSKKERSNLI